MTKANKAEKAVKKERKELQKQERDDALRVLAEPPALLVTLVTLATQVDEAGAELEAKEKELVQLRGRVDRFAVVELEVTEFAKQLRAEADPECDTTAFIYAHKVCGGNEIISRPIPRAAILGLL